MDECEQRRIWRVRGEQREPAEDEIAREEPLEIRVNGHALTVTMRTPGHDEDLAAGFLVSEGIITAAAEIAEIRRTVRPDCNSVEVQLRDGVEVDLARLTRHVFASSSCGVCGKTTIAAVLQQFPPIASELAVPAAVIRSLPAKLSQSQPSFRRSGGLHAAAIFTATGELEIAREDIGRHNAVDKVIGEALRRDALPLDRHILLVSGRASFEIMQKALAARLPIVAAVSAPSNLAIELAEENGQTLIGFLRGDDMNLYANAQRIL